MQPRRQCVILTRDGEIVLPETEEGLKQLAEAIVAAYETYLDRKRRKLL